MKQNRTYHFPNCRMQCEGNEVTTVYDDGASCRVWVIPEDEEHAKALNIQPAEHKQLHEISHMMLALAMGKDTCPIIRAQALLQPMPENATELEQMIMAMSYAALRVPMPYPDWWVRLDWVSRFTNPYALAYKIHLLFIGQEVDNIKIS